VQVFIIRGGKLFGREHFVLEGTQDEVPTAIMTSFVQQYYGSAPVLPDAILLQCPVDDIELISMWLRERKRRKVRLEVPQRGEKKRLMDMVVENARLTLQQLHIKWLADTGKTAAALTELQDMLDLPQLPRRIECYDISNISGTSSVGSMAVFQDGKPKTNEYRRFRIKTVSGVDDYGMMQEMLRRRFRRAQPVIPTEEADTDVEVTQEPSWALPDLVIIDGGRGHLTAAMEVMRSLGLHTIPTCALAKQQEEVFLPYVAESVMLARGSQGLYLLQRVRDEAHRFAITYHRVVRSKAATSSVLEEVPGVGPRRRKALLNRFGSVRALKDAPVEEIAAVRGMTRSLAEKVKALA